MPTARSQMTIIAGADGRIYAFGGLTDSGEVSTVEIFDPLGGEPLVQQIYPFILSLPPTHPHALGMGHDYIFTDAGRIGHLDDETPPGIVAASNYIDKNA